MVARKLESMSNLYHSWVSKLPVARDGMVYDPCVVQNVGRFQGMAASSIINTVSSLLCPPQLILRIFKIHFSSLSFRRVRMSENCPTQCRNRVLRCIRAASLIRHTL